MNWKKIKDKKFEIAFVVIMILGVFLRSYEFSELLRFGKDQARDAKIITNILENEQEIPLLGPKAGGTSFKMGPIFYYFQLASAKVFGDSPDKMAYPDLLFSILTLPMVFLFMRKFFDKWTSLALMALYTVSFFAVQNGRFAWNPNSLPLFSMLTLYAALELINPKQQKKWLWAIIAGISIGIGIQLHTLFILVMGITLLMFAVYFLRKKELSLKYVLAILAITLFVNFPQAISEIKTGGENSKAFIAGITEKELENQTAAQLTITQKLGMNVLWHMQSNAMFVSSIGDDTKSGFSSLWETLEENEKGMEGVLREAPMILRIFLYVAFSTVGYFLFGYFIKEEKDRQKKNFLILLSLYCIVSFLVFLPLSHVLVLRYFLIMQFIPFVFLGLIGKLISQRCDSYARWAFWFAVALLFVFNSYVVAKELRSFETGKGDVGIAIWSEEKFAGEFLLSHSDSNQKIHFVYEPQNANKFIRSLAYFNETVEAPETPNDATPLNQENVAYFSLVLNKKGDIKNLQKKVEKSKIYRIADSGFFGRIAIYKLELTNGDNGQK